MEELKEKVNPETPVVDKVKKEKVNPFDKGVSYAEFLEALGKTSVKDYLKNICTEEQIDWLEKELSIINKK